MFSWSHKSNPKQALSKTFLCLLIAGAPTLVAPALATSSQVIELNNEGVRALNASNFTLAEKKFQEALKLDPSYQTARSNLSIALNNHALQLQSNPMAAAKLFWKALVVDPNNATTKQNLDGIIRMMHRDPNKFQDRVDLGDAQRKSGNFEGAMIEYKAAIAIKNDASVHEKLGDVLRVRNKLNDAIAEYKLAIGIEDTAGREVKLGQALQANKNVGEAILAYGKALKLNPDDTDVLDALVAGWEAALAVNPIAPENHIGLGQALQYRGDFAQAAEEYKQAIRFSPGRQNAVAQKLLAGLPAAQKKAELEKMINNGVHFFEQKNYEAALSSWKQALGRDPKNPNVLVNIGTAYQAMKQFKEAMQFYQQGLQFDQANKAAIQGLKTCKEGLREQNIDQLNKDGKAAFAAKDFDKAIAIYMKLLEFDQKDAAVHFNIGAAKQAKKDYDGAIAEYRLAVQLDPKNKDYKSALAGAKGDKADPIIQQAIKAHEAKDYITAVSLYKKALILQPKNDEVWYNLAAAQYAMEDYTGAKTAYQKAYDIDPKGRVDDLYYIAVIQEHFGDGAGALAQYKKYLQKAPQGKFLSRTKDRIVALQKNLTATIKIKSQKEIAQEKAAEKAYEAAVALQRAKNYDEAILKYQDAISKNPIADYIYALGTCYQAAKKYELAMQQYTTAKAKAPKNKEIDKAIALLKDDQAGPIVEDAVNKQKAGDIQGAIAGYQKALQLIPKNARIWTNLGTAQQQADNFQQAKQSYKKGYDLDQKGEVGNLYLMAQIEENYGDGIHALQHYQLYLRDAPGGPYADAARNRKDALTKNTKDTQKLMTSSDRKNLTVASDAFKKAQELANQKNYDEAIKETEIAAGAQPKESAYPYAIGTFYQAKGDIDNAVPYYKKAIALAPDKKTRDEYQKVLDNAIGQKVAPAYNDANTKYGAKDYAGAIEGYQNVLKIDPKLAEVYQYLGACYQNVGNFQQARAAFQKGYDIGGKAQVDNLYFIGGLDENDGNVAGAIAQYQKYAQLSGGKGTYVQQANQRVEALRADPKSAIKIVTAAQAEKNQEAQGAYDEGIKLQTAQKYDEAIEAYKKAIAISPQNDAFLYAIGTAYQNKNDLDNALLYYEKAKAIKPNEKTYLDVIQQIQQLKAAPLADSAIKKQTTDLGGGKYDLPGAIADYLASLRIYDDPSTRMNLGTAYQGNNNPQQALQEYTKAINKDPKLADAYYFRGTVYEELKNPNAAIRDYKKYVQLAPTGQYLKDAQDRLKIVKPVRKRRRRR